MSEKVNPQGHVVETKDVDGVVGVMPFLATDTTNAKVDFSGYLYKEKELDGIVGRMPVVSLEGGSGGNTSLLESNTNIIWVNADYKGSVEDGSIVAPFTKFDDAHDKAIDGSIIMLVESSSEYVCMNSIQKSISIIGIGMPSTRWFYVKASNVRLTNIVSNDSLWLTGDISNVFIEKCIFSSLCIDGNVDNIHINDCIIESGFVMGYSSTKDYTKAGSVYLSNSKVGRFYVTGLYGDNSKLYIVNCVRHINDKEGFNATFIGSYLSTTISGCTGYSIEHKKGKLDVYSSSFSLNATSGISIESSVESSPGWIDVRDKIASLNLFSGVAEGKINKVGYCPYYLGTFSFDEVGSTLNGDRMDTIGLNSIQMYDKNIRVGYTPAGNTLKDHLDGISSKISELETKLNALSA